MTDLDEAFRIMDAHPNANATSVFTSSGRAAREFAHRATASMVGAVRDRKAAKFWLAPVRGAYNHDFHSNELNRIAAIVTEHEAALLKAWYEYFGTSNGNGHGQERQGH